MARNPFRSEAEAYRFLLLTVGYFALIVVAASIATWLGVVVFVALTAAAVVLWLRARSNEPALRPSVPTHTSAEDERRDLDAGAAETTLRVGRRHLSGLEPSPLRRARQRVVARHVLARPDAGLAVLRLRRQHRGGCN